MALLIHPRDIVDFAERRIRLTEGTRKGQLINIRERSSWMVKPLQECVNDTRESVTIYKAAGCGGTYIGEIVASYIFTHLAGNYGFQALTKDKARELANRLFHKLEGIDIFRARMSKDAIKDDKTLSKLFKWGFQFLRIQAANETNAQSDRLRMVLNDEAWQWDHGMIDQFGKRLEGDNPYGREINISTAAELITAEIAAKFRRGCQDEYNLTCPHCGNHFVPMTGSESIQAYGMHVIQWPDSGDINFKCANVKFICPGCPPGGIGEFKDRDKDRLSLLEGAKYIPGKPNADPRHYSCRFRAWVVWFVKLGKLLEEHLNAKEKLETGDVAPYREFRIKREAVTYEPKKLEGEEIKVTADFALDFVREGVPSFASDTGMWIGTGWSQQIDYFMTVDVQLKFFWVTVWDIGYLGIARKKWIGKVDNWNDIASLVDYFEIREAFSCDGVPLYAVGVDCATWGREHWTIYRELARRRWIGLEGLDTRAGFDHIYETEDEESGEILKHKENFAYSEWIKRHPEVGLAGNAPGHCHLIQWSSRRIKDQAWNILCGRGTYLGIPANWEQWQKCQDWKPQEGLMHQLESESLQVVSTGQAGTPKQMWVKNSNDVHNHIWDTYCMFLAMQQLSGIFDIEPPTQSSSTERESQDQGSQTPISGMNHVSSNQVFG